MDQIEKARESLVHDHLMLRSRKYTTRNVIGKGMEIL
jgi:hypothetical protein